MIEFMFAKNIKYTFEIELAITMDTIKCFLVIIPIYNLRFQQVPKLFFNVQCAWLFL